MSEKIAEILEEILKANANRDKAIQDLITAVKNINARLTALESKHANFGDA